MRSLQNAALRQQPQWTARVITWRRAVALPRVAAGSVLRRPQLPVCASLACTPMAPALSGSRRLRKGRQLAVRTVAMVNVDFASPSLLLGTMLIGCGVLLLNLRNFQNKVSRDADIVVAAMVSIVGSTLIFQGWRLDPLLLLCQALTTSVAFWYGLETFRLRSKEADLPPQLPPGVDASSLDAVQQQMQQQQQPQYYQGGAGFPSAGAQGVPYLPPGSESYYPWGSPADGAASTSGRVGAAAGPYETIQYDYYGNPIMPQQEPAYESAGRYSPYAAGAAYGARPSAFGSGDGGSNPSPPADVGYGYGAPPGAAGTSYPGPSASPPDTYGDGGGPGTGSPAPPADVGYDYGTPPLVPGTSYPGPSAPPPDSYGLPPVSTPTPPPLPDGTLAPGQFDFAVQPPSPSPLGASSSGRGGSSSTASGSSYYSPGAGTAGPAFDGFGAAGYTSTGLGAGGWGPGVTTPGAAAAAATPATPAAAAAAATAGRSAAASSGGSSGGRLDLFEKVDDWE